MQNILNAKDNFLFVFLFLGWNMTQTYSSLSFIDNRFFITVIHKGLWFMFNISETVENKS